VSLVQRTISAAAATVVLTLTVGFLQLQVHAISLGLSFSPTGTLSGTVPRYPWELQVLTFVLAAAYIGAYLRFFQQVLPRVTSLTVLVAVTLFGWSASPVLLGTPAAAVAEKLPMPVLALGLGYAGGSPVWRPLAALFGATPAWRSLTKKR
jgi:hypothetical protein